MSLRILILEDDPFIAWDLQAIVEGEGHSVVGVCDSLVEARRRLAEAFDFALLDIDVADGKSYEVASTLSERRIPFAFVSASASDAPTSSARCVARMGETWWRVFYQRARDAGSADPGGARTASRRAEPAAWA